MSLDNLFEQIRQKLASQKNQNSSTETADVAEIETYLYGVLPAQSAETAVIEERKKIAASIFDQGETKVRQKTEAIKNACASLKWCAPYNQEQTEYQRNIMEYIIAINGLQASYEKGTPIDKCIRDHILLAIDESIIPEQEKLDKKEEFLHKTLLVYLGFCKNRIKLVEQCEHVPEEIKKPVHKVLEDTYQLAFSAIAKSVKLRNPDTKISKEELKRLWDRGGLLREKSTNAIDYFSDEAAEYFKKESMNEQARYSTIMHSKEIKEILEKIEQQTGLEGFASKITDYI